PKRTFAMGTLFVGWRGRATLARCDFQLLLQLTNNPLQKSVKRKTALASTPTHVNDFTDFLVNHLALILAVILEIIDIQLIRQLGNRHHGIRPSIPMVPRRPDITNRVLNRSQITFLVIYLDANIQPPLPHSIAERERIGIPIHHGHVHLKLDSRIGFDDYHLILLYR
ncbi:hypothetical protein, partial [Halosimplex halobium]|uniref:hypothetical protein n=1 Tax=Halosimplex halobium TaxID=3396618 RepID=UPI003F55D50D